MTHVHRDAVPDHVAAAQGMLDTIAEGVGDGPIRIEFALAAAQVHATLALVEDQRTANRLAVAALDQVSEHSHAPEEFRIRPYLSDAEWKRLDIGGEGDA